MTAEKEKRGGGEGTNQRGCRSPDATQRKRTAQAALGRLVHHKVHAAGDGVVVHARRGVHAPAGRARKWGGDQHISKFIFRNRHNKTGPQNAPPGRDGVRPHAHHLHASCDAHIHCVAAQREDDTRATALRRDDKRTQVGDADLPRPRQAARGRARRLAGLLDDLHRNWVNFGHSKETPPHEFPGWGKPREPHPRGQPQQACAHTPPTARAGRSA